MTRRAGTANRASFDPQPTLAGDLLHLRPLRADDFEALFRVASDPRIWEQHPEPERCHEPVFRKFFRDALDSGGALVAVHAATGEIIGSSRYNWADLKVGPDDDHGCGDHGDELEIGWSFLARGYWGGVYNREMKRLMLEYAFQFVDRVIFVVGVDNVRSRKAMLNIGGVLTDRRVAQALPAVRSESVIFEIAKDRWSG